MGYLQNEFTELLRYGSSENFVAITSYAEYNKIAHFRNGRETD